MERYHRQELIEGWDQEKLRKAKIAVIGDGPLAEYSLIPLAALGIGEIRILGNSEGGKFMDFAKETGDKLEYLKTCLEKLNPDVEVIPIHGVLCNDSVSYFLKGCDIVIDTTNSESSKAIASDAQNYVSVTGSGNRGFVSAKKGTQKGKEHVYALEGGQDKTLSLVLGGIVAGEVKKMLMDEESSFSPVFYNAETDMQRLEVRKENETDYSDKKALVVGAGALGNFVALGLSELGIGEVDIIDDDTIEETNLNRQILYYDSIGKPKADTLANKLKKMNSSIKTKSIRQRFEKEIEGDYDIIFECVDNLRTRAALSDFALKEKMPLVSGGTDYKSGQVAVYVPGRACLDCQLNLKQAAEKSESESCIYAPNPSVIFTNQIIGGAMVNEAKHILNGNNVLKGRLNYDNTLEGRLGKSETIGECEHG